MRLLSVIVCLLSLAIIGCASSGPTDIELEIRNQESQRLRQLQEEAYARTARLKELQQGVKARKNWEVNSIIDPVTQAKTCVIQLAPDSAKSYNGHNIDLSFTAEKTMLRVKTLTLLNDNGSGISVDGKPIYLFEDKTETGDLTIKKTQPGLLSDLISGKTAELSFAIVDSSGIHKLQLKLDGFRESYLKLDSC